MPTEQMNVSLPPRMAKFIRGKVKAGEYTNASEVVRDALRHMQAAEEDRKHLALLNAFGVEDDEAVIGIREGVAQLEAGEYLELGDETALKEYFSDAVSRAKARATAKKGKAGRK